MLKSLPHIEPSSFPDLGYRFRTRFLLCPGLVLLQKMRTIGSRRLLDFSSLTHVNLAACEWRDEHTAVVAPSWKFVIASARLVLALL